MATISKVAMLVAGGHLVAIAWPSAAYAQRRVLVEGSPAPLELPMTAVEAAAGTPAAPVASPLTARLPTANPTTASAVWVHLEGSQVAELQRDTAGDRRNWVTVCLAPCDQAVSTEFSYRIAGDGIRNSRVFSVQPQSGDRETITVDEGSKAAFVAGILGVSVGALTMTIGLLVLLAESIATGLEDGSDTQDRSNEALGAGLAGLGLAGVVGGSVAIATNARTGVTQGAVSSQGASLSPAGSAGAAAVAGLQGPLNHAFEEGHRDSAWAGALPPLVGVPLFGGRF